MIQVYIYDNNLIFQQSMQRLEKISIREERTPCWVHRAQSMVQDGERCF